MIIPEIALPPPGQRPKNVGIHALEVYFPTRCVDEVELEKYDGVSPGKYTVGLDVHHMAFTDDREDINSFSLNAVSSLLKKYNIPLEAVGRLEVGTETVVDKSKSVKTVLMDLFVKSGNMDILGVDCKNACYGATSAFFSAINWVQSESWDGRWAIVVAADIAIYGPGNARAVGGAGAAAILIGPDAPLVLEPIQGTHMENVWDFYKPNLRSEYPAVDGPLTLTAYLDALDFAYDSFRAKAEKKYQLAKGSVTATSFDYFAFHTPYGKLAQKGAGRLVYNDYLTHPTAPQFRTVDPSFLTLERLKTPSNKKLEKVFVDLSSSLYRERFSPSMAGAWRLGNSYTASLWISLASLIDAVDPETLKGKRIGLYSYGAGQCASFFALQVKGDTSGIRQTLQLGERLASTVVAPPTEYMTALEFRERNHARQDFEPEGKISNIAPGSFYLAKIDDRGRRQYLQARLPLANGA